MRRAQRGRRQHLTAPRFAVVRVDVQDAAIAVGLLDKIALLAPEVGKTEQAVNRLGPASQQPLKLDPGGVSLIRAGVG